MFTNNEKSVLTKMSERGKVAVPSNVSKVPPGMMVGLLSLNQRGFMELLDSKTRLENVPGLFDMYGLTQEGMTELLGALKAQEHSDA